VDPLLLGAGIALLVPLVTRGSYRRILERDWRALELLGLGVVAQLLLDLGAVPERYWSGLGFALLLASYGLLVAFCARNLLARGMAIVLLGILANGLAIAVNHGMPVDVPRSWLADGTYTESVKHHPQRPDDRFIVLTDIIVIPGPVASVVSFGDLIIAVGLVDVAFHTSRARKRRARVAAPAHRALIVFDGPGGPDLDLVAGAGSPARPEPGRSAVERDYARPTTTSRASSTVGSYT
jgi:hypothetical protein